MVLATHRSAPGPGQKCARVVARKFVAVAFVQSVGSTSVGLASCDPPRGLLHSSRQKEITQSFASTACKKIFGQPLRLRYESLLNQTC
eukprot:m.213431 g.213431  ORF g.213431 m.213431 type:complete len:88 (-) comp18606_c0_seq6:170-433(-)